MQYKMKYIDNSMNFCSWKANFVETFIPAYLFFKDNFDVNKLNDTEYAKDFISYFLALFFKICKLLKKKIKEDDMVEIHLFSDVINFAEQAGLISNKKQYFEIIKFSNEYFNNSDVSKFKLVYLDVLDEFRNTFSKLARNGNMENEYVVVNNADKLWGIDKVSYNMLINYFKQEESVKIVRIFGSRAMPACKEFSDIDLMLEGTFSFKKFFKVKKNISNIKIPYFVDAHSIYSEYEPFIYTNTVRSNVFYERKKYFHDEYISPIEEFCFKG